MGLLRLTSKCGTWGPCALRWGRRRAPCHVVVGVSSLLSPGLCGWRDMLGDVGSLGAGCAAGQWWGLAEPEVTAALFQTAMLRGGPPGTADTFPRSWPLPPACRKKGRSRRCLSRRREVSPVQCPFPFHRDFEKRKKQGAFAVGWVPAVDPGGSQREPRPPLYSLGVDRRQDLGIESPCQLLWQMALFF